MKERSGMPYDVVAFETDEHALALTSQEEGLFHRMMRKAWINGSVPADLTALAQLIRERPSTVRKAWPHLAKMWTPMEGNPSRLQNKKQESERAYKEKIRVQNMVAGKLSAKVKKDKGDGSTDVQREGNGRSTSLPSPSHPSPVEEANTDKSSPPPPDLQIGAQRRSPRMLFEIYNTNRGTLPEARFFTKEREVKCRKRLHSNNGTFLEDFTRSIQRAAVLPFCLGEGDRYWKVDFDWAIANDTNYLKILEGKYDHVRQERHAKTKDDLNAEAGQRLLSRLDSQDRERGNGGADGSESGDVSGTPAKTHA